MSWVGSRNFASQSKEGDAVHTESPLFFGSEQIAGPPDQPVERIGRQQSPNESRNRVDDSRDQTTGPAETGPRGQANIRCDAIDGINEGFPWGI